MPKRKTRKLLKREEISIIKAMLATGEYFDQDILAFFTRPTRSINQREISHIKNGKRYQRVRVATTDELNEFLKKWPNTDYETGLEIDGDELLVKARESMIAAVHLFNGAGLKFRAELFIVTSVIAWTYLMHAYFRREGVEYRYRASDGTFLKTKQGAFRYWELSKCIESRECPVPSPAKKNLEFLIELRNEIEHRSTSRIDDAVSAKLQACCINFNDMLKKLFGVQYGLERRIPIALQFVSFQLDQRKQLKSADNLPQNISAFIDAFEENLTEEQYLDPAYRYRVAFVPIAAKRPSAADVAYEFVSADSDEAREMSAVYLKEVNKRRYTAKEVIKTINEKGYPAFNMTAHTNLWKQLDGKKPSKGYGCKGDYKNTWVWYDSWINRVLEHCAESGEKYK